MNFKPLKIGNLTAKIPLIQGGMGVGISLSGLAGAVAKEGGIGLISTAQIGFRRKDFNQHPIEANLEAIPEELEKARKIAPGGIIGFNIMVATKRYEEYVKAAVKAGADLIVSGAGLPVDLPAYVRGFQTKLAPIVSSLKAAALVCKLWDRRYQTAPDLVVIEGPQAGGHLGFSHEDAEHLSTAEFEDEIRKIQDVVKTYEKKYEKGIPVVVAGGIYGREDIRHALEDLDADGVQIGTRFVTTEECDAPMAFKQAYLDASEEDIIVTKSPVGMPGRALRNNFLKEVALERKKPGRCRQCLEKCKREEIPYCITDALLNSANGNTDQGLVFCGGKAYCSNKIEKVTDVVAELFGLCGPQT